MMECMSGMMMFGTGLVWLLVVVVLVLGTAALIKYLFSSGGKGEGRRSSYDAWPRQASDWSGHCLGSPTGWPVAAPRPRR
ncbi:hypothetical protein [Mesorhizobium sp.]|uniref:hypothetical protein n=1 Tax=Mesorhizobium sp. TaxID=1871066 RepID=UPI000FE7440D|nr:hypothetical protein [Mesorhizobium sp.]RWQ15379.1 MAG: hypothetical protein EOR93_27255 [Mesorhizobium sp.]TIN27264.1 MAG: hypothetical protein E5Y31_14075 [Mesorhizobium sp.]